ncbi:MAG: TIGR03960 family B12-binding radical SAM protein [Clostridiales bacterium]|nr:TIGR03960 family B12-binding radical SAM protein [Clostridiales bacterium]
MDKQLLDRLMGQAEKPVRYMGNELNMVIKNIDSVDIRFAFAFPDIYEIGMSHLGMKIMYHLINEREDSYCERVFAPWTDMEELMRQYDIPLFALETKDPIKDFDIIGFTLQYEMSYTNILNMLDLGQIPLTWAQRNEDHPLIIGGGPCAYNIEPMADFFDLVVMGEGEEVIHELLDLYSEGKKQGLKRTEFLYKATDIKGIYVPRFYEARYADDGRVLEVLPVDKGVPPVISKRVVKNLDKVFYPETMIVPYMDIVHDRIMLEIFRGCTKGCRFCQAGMIYRPVREKSPQRLLELAEKLVENTGYEEISLSSLSTGDYSQLEELVKELMIRFKEKRVALSLPSLRLDSFVKDLTHEVQGVRKTGLTFAPEAGSQRLRDVINKGITEGDLIRSAEDAFKSGWTRLKFYFMIGLPEEREEDLKEIGTLARKIKDCYFDTRKTKGGPMPRISISTSSFVPKPFTPFQWVAQSSMEELADKQKLLQDVLRIRHVTYTWNDPGASLLEAVFARGDRRLGKVLIRAWQSGCIFDGWAEHFKFDAWMAAFEKEGLDPHFYANRVRDKDEIFPWDHIDVKVTKKYLWAEYQKAVRAELTQDCRLGCTGCSPGLLGEGLCP